MAIRIVCHPFRRVRDRTGQVSEEGASVSAAQYHDAHKYCIHPSPYKLCHDPYRVGPLRGGGNLLGRLHNTSPGGLEGGGVRRRDAVKSLAASGPGG